MSKKEEKYISNLLSDNQELITETFEQIREEGNTAVLPYLFDLLASSLGEGIKKEIYKLLCELKQTGAVPILIEAITNEKYAGIQEQLIRICWENGLDYSPYLSTFVDIVINGNFINAFEAFTVIENMEGTFDNEMLKGLIAKLETSIDTSPIENRIFITDIIKMFK
jgi:hypothetical protein